MDFNIKDLQFFPIHEIKLENWFRSIQSNDFTPTPEQRREMISIIDERVKINSEGLRMVYDICKNPTEGSPEYQKINHVLNNLFFYIYQTTSDCMVASKNYLLADQDYDKRYARGKLRVILNEGFKNLYGFPQTKKSKTYWGELSIIMNHFPGLDRQYQMIGTILENQSKQSSWWKHERDLEVHLEPVKLFESRQEELNESKVMVDTIQLLDALGIVEQFVGNLHALFTNWLNSLYLRHPEYFKGE